MAAGAVATSHRVDGPVKHAGDLEHLLDGVAVRPVQLLGVELDPHLGRHQLGDALEELDPLALGGDLIVDAQGGIVPVDQKEKDVRDQHEVRLLEGVEADGVRVAQVPEDLDEVALLPEGHGGGGGVQLHHQSCY